MHRFARLAIERQREAARRRMLDVHHALRDLTHDPGRFFGLSNGYWLRAQAAHDTERAERELGPILRTIKPWAVDAA